MAAVGTGVRTNPSSAQHWLLTKWTFLALFFSSIKLDHNNGDKKNKASLLRSLCRWRKLIYVNHLTPWKAPGTLSDCQFPALILDTAYRWYWGQSYMSLCFSSFEWWSVCAIWCRCWWDTSSACRQLCFLPPSHPSSSAITLILFPYQLASVSPVSLSASSGKPFVLLMAFTFLHILFSWLNDCLTVSGRWFISITQVCIWKMECMEREGETVSGIKAGVGWDILWSTGENMRTGNIPVGRATTCALVLPPSLPS